MQEVFIRDHGKCVLRGSEDNLHYDHKIPFSKCWTSIDAKNIQEIAAQNGSFLSMLNKQMGLNLNKIEEKKKGIRSKGAKRASTKRKVRVSGAIQTFFADLFPSGESSETNLSSWNVPCVFFFF